MLQTVRRCHLTNSQNCDESREPARSNGRVVCVLMQGFFSGAVHVTQKPNFPRR